MRYVSILIMLIILPDVGIKNKIPKYIDALDIDTRKILSRYLLNTIIKIVWT